MEVLYYRDVDNQHENEIDISSYLMICDESLRNNSNYNDLVNVFLAENPGNNTNILEEILTIVKAAYATSLRNYIKDLYQK
jgi:hypothetical protein